MVNWVKKVINFYYEGFKNMTWGKNLWVIILVKLFIMFVILKIFFFPSVLSSFDTPKERADYVLQQLSDTVRIDEMYDNRKKDN